MNGEVDLGKRLLLLYRADGIVDLADALVILDHGGRGRRGPVGVHFEAAGVSWQLRGLWAGRGRTTKRPTSGGKTREGVGAPGKDGYERVGSRTGWRGCGGLVARGGWRKGGELEKMALRKETKGGFRDVGTSLTVYGDAVFYEGVPYVREGRP